MKFTEYELKELERHYKTIKILGITYCIWFTTPKRMVKHLKELIHQIRILNYEQRTGKKFKGSRNI